MNTPLFSIIIPVFNLESYIFQCLESVSNQTLKDYEVIIVDDSTDGSSKVISDYISDKSNFYLISDIKKGLGGARNKGVEASKGEYLIFLDGDDWIAKNAVEIIKMSIQSSPDILGFNTDFFSENDLKTSPDYKLNHLTPGSYTGMEFFNKFVKEHGYGPSAVCLYSFKSLLFREYNLKFSETLLHEDELFMPQALFFAEKINIINSHLYVYRERKGSMTNKVEVKKAIDKLSISEILFSFFEENNSLNIYVSKSIHNLVISSVNEAVETMDCEDFRVLKNRILILLKKVSFTKKERFICHLLSYHVVFYKLYLKVKGLRNSFIKK